MSLSSSLPQSSPTPGLACIFYLHPCAWLACVLSLSLSLARTDMAKTRVQTSAAAVASPRARANFPSAPSYRTTLQTLTKVMEEEGAKRWFCGLGPVLIGSAPAMVAQITAYEAVRNFLSRDGQDPKDLKIQLAAGIVSGFSHGAVSAPMEVLKVRGQVLGKAAGGLVESVQMIGLQGLFKGVSGCWARDIPFSCIYFPTYSYVKDQLEAKGQPPFVCTMGAGIIAGVLAAAPTTPCDVVKTRLQNPSAASQGLLQTVKRMYTVEGPASFFVGVKPRVGRVAPYVALSLTGYETLKALGASEPVQKMLGLYKEPTPNKGKR
jgi:solute carrier family 25 (mitochondrial aspartate/glutamate transporter), member 12/13